eukprot:403352300
MEGKGSDQPYVTLSNGNKMPQIGLGTFNSLDEDLKKVVKSAVLEHGYRHIDTASLYDNEGAIGDALQECFAEGVKREDVFITTKLWQAERDDVEGALRRSLTKLKVDYIDLYLLHWMAPKMEWDDEVPIKNTPTHIVWAELERLVDAGLIKNIGVSNCTIPMLLDLLAYARHKPATNQVELHPYLVQKEFVEFHKKLNVTVTAYAPLGSNSWPFRSDELKKLNVLEEKPVADLSVKYGKSPAQIVLNWHLHRGHIVIPKTLTLGRLSENFNVYDFKLTDEEYESITKLDIKARFYNPIAYYEYGWRNCPYFE